MRHLTVVRTLHVWLCVLGVALLAGCGSTHRAKPTANIWSDSRGVHTECISIGDHDEQLPERLWKPCDEIDGKTLISHYRCKQWHGVYRFSDFCVARTPGYLP